jgi:hypothetical protein
MRELPCVAVASLAERIRRREAVALIASEHCALWFVESRPLRIAATTSRLHRWLSAKI